MKSKKILFSLTGSIACYKACFVISKLIQKGYDLQIICSKNALNFIGKATLEGLTQKEVLTDMFDKKLYTKHIELSSWADIFVICPATANIINKLAQGIADDYISTTFLSWNLKKPCLIFPAMNENMYIHPITRQAIKKLNSIGVYISPTSQGYLACGVSGKGRLLEPEQIIKIIEKYL
ncbi:MAG: flavoprotein [Elusimicrobiota bacterium]